MRAIRTFSAGGGGNLAISLLALVVGASLTFAWWLSSRPLIPPKPDVLEAAEIRMADFPRPFPDECRAALTDPEIPLYDCLTYRSQR